MLEKIIKCRLIQKHDTQSNWELNQSFIPKQGEMIVYDIDDNYNYERMKIGDGKTIIGALPFVDDPIRTLIENLDNDKLDAAELPYAIDDALTKAKDGGEFDGADGADGVTFTPTVDAAGNLSWTNDGELPNPTTVNIKGPAGANGFTYRGTNPFASTGLDLDTRQTWAGMGSGYWWIAGWDNVKDQPSQYGFLLNMAYGTGEAYQVFFASALNSIHVRSGGAGSAREDGWYRANSSTDTIWRGLVFADTLSVGTSTT